MDNIKSLDLSECHLIEGVDLKKVEEYLNQLLLESNSSQKNNQVDDLCYIASLRDLKKYIFRNRDRFIQSLNSRTDSDWILEDDIDLDGLIEQLFSFIEAKLNNGRIKHAVILAYHEEIKASIWKIILPMREILDPDTQYLVERYEYQKNRSIIGAFWLKNLLNGITSNRRKNALEIKSQREELFWKKVWFDDINENGLVQEISSNLFLVSIENHSAYYIYDGSYYKPLLLNGDFLDTRDLNITKVDKQKQAIFISTYQSTISMRGRSIENRDESWILCDFLSWEIAIEDNKYIVEPIQLSGYSFWRCFQVDNPTKYHFKWRDKYGSLNEFTSDEFDNPSVIDVNIDNESVIIMDYSLWYRRDLSVFCDFETGKLANLSSAEKEKSEDRHKQIAQFLNMKEDWKSDNNDLSWNISILETNKDTAKAKIKIANVFEFNVDYNFDTKTIVIEDWYLIETLYRDAHKLKIYKDECGLHARCEIFDANDKPVIFTACEIEKGFSITDISFEKKLLKIDWNFEVSIDFDTKNILTDWYGNFVKIIDIDGIIYREIISVQWVVIDIQFKQGDNFRNLKIENIQDYCLKFDRVSSIAGGSVMIKDLANNRIRLKCNLAEGIVLGGLEYNWKSYIKDVYNNFYYINYARLVPILDQELLYYLNRSE